MNPRRLLPVLRLAALVTAVLFVSACAGSHAPEPTLPTVDFRPKLDLTVTDTGVQPAAGSREDPNVHLDGTTATLPSGTVVRVVNDSSTDQRVFGNGGAAFDTGTLRPKGATTVVLTNDAADDLRIAITTAGRAEPRATIVVKPKPGA